MASQGYRDWLNAGRPYTLIRPAAALVRKLQAYGLTVYGLGPPNAAHLEATTPEDHTPFSVTGWPGTNRRWNARALDVMPRSGSATHRKENADIARQLIRDRDGGHPGAMWIKYINWTDEQGNCQQVRWMDAAHPLQHTTRSSSDRGHIHISGRSDADGDDRADGYDPIARMRGNLAGGDDMQLSDQNPFGKSPSQFTREDRDSPLWLMDGPNGNVAAMFQYVLENSHFARLFARRAAAESAALRAVVEQLTAVLAKGGGSVDTAAILAGVDERLAKLAAEQRDAVADLGEGGAAQVRGEQAEAPSP